MPSEGILSTSPASACALGALGRYSLATGVLGAILRWFVYGPLEAALRQALRPEAPGR